MFHTREDHAVNTNLLVKFVNPFTFTDIQRMKTGLFHKSSRVCLIDSSFVYLSSHGTLKSVAFRTFEGCHPYQLVCSK